MIRVQFVDSKTLIPNNARWSRLPFASHTELPEPKAATLDSIEEDKT
jgi:hypothetical protein